MSANLNKTNVVDFSVFSAAALISALVWVYAPLFSLIAMLIIPVSLAMLVRRQDLRYGLFSLLLMTVVLSVFTAKPQLALLLVLQTGPLGLLLGLLLKNNVSWGKGLMAAVFFSFIVAVVIFLIDYYLTGHNPFVLDDKQRYLIELEHRMLYQMFGQKGTAGELDPDTINKLKKTIDRLEAAWPVLAMSSTLIWVMVLAASTYWLTRRVMRGFGYSVSASIPFSRWRLPWYFIWGVIAGLALLLGGDQIGTPSLVVAGKVVLWVMGFVFLVIGVSMCAFYLQRPKIAWPFKLLGLVLIVLYLPVAAVALAATGIIDSIVNIRRLTPDGRIPEEDGKK